MTEAGRMLRYYQTSKKSTLISCVSVGILSRLLVFWKEAAKYLCYIKDAFLTGMFMSEYDKILWRGMLSKEKTKKIDAKCIARIPITEELLPGIFSPAGMLEVND